MGDPTYDELKEALATSSECVVEDEGSVEEAIYAFASDYHGGQWSSLYEALCLSEFEPGPLWDGIEAGTEADFLYGELEELFGAQ